MPSNSASTFWEKAPVLGGFFVHEVDKNLDIRLTATGYYFGDLQIGSYNSVHMESTIEHLKIVAVQRVNTQLRKMIQEIEEQR